MSKNLKNKTEGIRAARLNFQPNGATGLSQTLNSPTSDGEESVAGANQNFLPHTFPQAQILQPKQAGKMSPNADVEKPDHTQDWHSQSLQALGEEGETKPMANPLRSSADDAIIEIYPYMWKDFQSPPTGKQILMQLYWQEELSLKRIAGMTGKSEDGVRYWMQKNGVPRRDPIEASIKATTIHKTKPFSGDSIERAYLMGLRHGDIHAAKSYRKIRATISTTHPLMEELFTTVFKAYAHVARYPDKGLATEFNWTLKCDLHPSFAFLIEKGKKIPDEIYSDNQQFLAFLAGFFDSEGSILIGKSDSVNAIRIRVKLDNKNLGVLKDIETKLKAWNLNPIIRPGGRVWTLWVENKNPAAKLLQMIPLRHLEKIRKREIALKAYRINQWHKIAPELQVYRIKIRQEVKTNINAAREAWLTKHPYMEIVDTYRAE